MSISLFNYSQQNPGSAEAAQRVHDLERMQKSCIASSIVLLAYGIMMFALMVHKYHNLNKPLPPIHYGVTLAIPCSFAVILAGVATAATYRLHRQQPVHKLTKQYPVSIPLVDLASQARQSDVTDIAD
ncbi:MAG: hypothetical protein ACKVOH_06875 [Chlamydiales bacterium]